MTPDEPARTLRPALSLWARVALAVMVAWLVATAVAGVVLSNRLRAIGEAELDQRVSDTVQLLAPPVRAALIDRRLDEVREIAAAGMSVRAVRVTVILPDGEVVAESTGPLPLENHSGRPEVRQALENGEGRNVRTSATTGRPYLYVAERLDGPDGKPLGLLRLALPQDAVEAFATQLSGALQTAALLALPLAGLLAWLAARWIARPLEGMTAAAARMAAGDFRDLPEGSSDDEAGRLAEALRSMGRGFEEMLASTAAQAAESDTILRSMGEGVLAVDAAERVLLANRSAGLFLGLRSTPEPGVGLNQLAVDPAVVELVRDALGGTRVPETDVDLPGPAGRTLEVTSDPVRGTDGEVRGAVAVLRDVTVMRRLEQTRLDFVENVSHELRTPLAAMLSALETVDSLRDDEVEVRAQMLETATRHGRRLAAIVDDLLTLSQIESEGDTLEMRPVALLSNLRSATNAVAAEAQRRGVAIHLPDGERVEVIGHQGRLEQVWVNLLGNAVKYNGEGGEVRVDVRVDSTSRRACVWVQDTGPGIPAEDLPRIFERFYRVDKARSRAAGGTGLGLAIVKHIIRAHRGRVDVESHAGEGTTFKVWLPLA